MLSSVNTYRLLPLLRYLVEGEDFSHPRLTRCAAFDEVLRNAFDDDSVLRMQVWFDSGRRHVVLATLHGEALRAAAYDRQSGVRFINDAMKRLLSDALEALYAAPPHWPTGMPVLSIAHACRVLYGTNERKGTR